VEESRTNLLLRSEEFQTTWTATRASVTADAAIAPNGTTTADKLVEDSTASNNHSIRQTPTTTVSLPHALSIYVKAAERSIVAFEMVDNGATGNGISAYFNLGTASTSNVTSFGNGSGASAVMSNVGDGWYRCVLSGVVNTSGTAIRCNVYLSQAAGSVSYTGDGTSGIYLWGAQLEAGAFPTSYIPTTTAAVTRSADVASISGSNFSSWYRQDEGTIYAEGSVPVGVSGSRALAGISDGTNSERIIISHNGTTAANGLVVDGNTSQTSFTVTANSFPPGERKKVALAYKVDDFGFTTVPGTTVEQDSSGTLPTVDRLQIGNAPGRTEPNQPIRRLTYWPQRLSNSTLQQITQ
jgi:hypothetical protein